MLLYVAFLLVLVLVGLLYYQKGHKSVSAGSAVYMHSDSVLLFNYVLPYSYSLMH
jgi:hypothetical protein